MDKIYETNSCFHVKWWVRYSQILVSLFQQFSASIKKNLSIERRLVATHPALRRRGDAAATSLCTSQRRRSYVPNETPNDFSMERHQDVSVIHLQDVILERRNDVSKGRYKGVSSVRLHNVSKESQMKHPVTSQRYVTKTSQWYVSTTSH